MAAFAAACYANSSQCDRLKQVSIRNAPTDIVRGDHDLNDTQWQLVAVCPFGEAPGYLLNTSRQNQGRSVEILTRSDYQAHAVGYILHIRTDFLDRVEAALSLK
jgi:hypothetical protein